MAITKEQIFTAAEELTAAGQRPTLAAIRQITGGSYTTISPALNEWKAMKATISVALRDPVPQLISERLAALGNDLWQLALDMANARLSAEREALEKERADLEADRDEAAELADQLTSEVELLRGQISTLEVSEEAARKEVSEISEKLAEAEGTVRLADARAQEVEHRIADLRAERDRTHQEARQATETAVQAREETARVSGEMEALRKQYADMLDRLTQSARTKM